jgi:DNA-binding TFAR19-related protein (PDSD5 family)
MNEDNDQQKEIERLEQLGKQYLDHEALTRYGTLKAAYPEKALKVIMYIANMAQMGKAQEKINDKDFKEILKVMDEGKKEYKIKRI